MKKFIPSIGITFPKGCVQKLQPNQNIQFVKEMVIVETWTNNVFLIKVSETR